MGPELPRRAVQLGGRRGRTMDPAGLHHRGEQAIRPRGMTAYAEVVLRRDSIQTQSVRAFSYVLAVLVLAVRTGQGTLRRDLGPVPARRGA